MVERGRRSTGRILGAALAAAFTIAVVQPVAGASRVCDSERMQDAGPEDGGSAYDGGIDGEMERAPPGADRDAPSEDDTAREPSEDGAAPGCTFQRGPLELLV